MLNSTHSISSGGTLVQKSLLPNVLISFHVSLILLVHIYDHRNECIMYSHLHSFLPSYMQGGIPLAKKFPKTNQTKQTLKKPKTQQLSPQKTKQATKNNKKTQTQTQTIKKTRTKTNTKNLFHDNFHGFQCLPFPFRFF